MAGMVLVMAERG